MKDDYDKMCDDWIIAAMREQERNARREACILVLQDAGEWSEIDMLRDLVRRLTSAYRNSYCQDMALLREALAAVDAMPPPPWEQ